MDEQSNTFCHYSGLASPMAYYSEEIFSKAKNKNNLLPHEIDRIIEMAWEDRTPFDAIFNQFGLREDEVKALMKKKLNLKSYQNWRKRVEWCKTKHAKKRIEEIKRFKCNRQRVISQNKISKRK